MSDHTYNSPDGTYLDVPSPPADAPQGAVVLDVSGHQVGISALAVVRLIDLLAEPDAHVALTIWASDAEEGPYLDVSVEKDGVKIGVRYDTTTTHQVTIPLNQAYPVMSAIYSRGLERGGAR
ncbi:hypothetical protein FAF44_02945 [Nonomuraea sp. MG754425]|uniref:hypothetical protein n=1 Tax=Nonomuraea sp. MG754425 TaxID=2570319 RepID=UPI001F451598|nr:hypothetical protein [Nonomuraea sp. MG754425]MCF6467372.1 hypothetical protein [Nonomuraea sp. MG754425]